MGTYLLEASLAPPGGHSGPSGRMRARGASLGFLPLGPNTLKRRIAFSNELWRQGHSANHRGHATSPMDFLRAN
eukprot:4838166-Pyramimonas_sp.AAC.1